MENYIICPCCGNKIHIVFEDGECSVFFVAENQDELQEVLKQNGIELGIILNSEKDV